MAGDQTERRVIEVLGKVDQQFAAQLKTIETTLGGIQKQVKGIQGLGTGILSSVIGVGFITTLTRMADTQTTLRRSLAATIPVGQDLAKTQEDLLGISIRTQQSLEAVTQLYTRLTIAITDVNIKQSDLNKVTEAFGNTMLIAGTGVREAAAATTQFGQALASGRLQGDEFRSLMENVPVLARVLAQNLETVNGQFGVTIGQLRDLSREGELTTGKIIDALVRGFDDLQKATANLPKTIGAAFQALTSSIGLLIGEVDRLHGISTTVAGVFTGLASAINQNRDAIASFGPVIVGGLVTAFLALGTQIPIVTGAIGLFAGAVGLSGGTLAIVLGSVVALTLALTRLADTFNLFGAETVTIEEAIGLKDTKTILERMNEVIAKLKELRATQAELTETRDRVQGKLVAADPGSSTSEAYARKLVEVNRLQKENRAEITATMEVLQVLNDNYLELEAGVDESTKAIRAAKAAQDAFNKGTLEIRGEIDKLKALNFALGDSKGAYDEVKRVQALGEKIAKDWAAAQKAGADTSKESKEAVRLLSIEEFNLTENLEKQLKIKEALAKVETQATQTDIEVGHQIALGNALSVSADAYERLKVELKAVAEVQDQLSKAIAEGATFSPEYVQGLVDQKVALANLTTANEKRLAGFKALEKFEQNVQDLQNKNAALRDQNEVLKVSVDAFDELVRSNEAVAEAERILQPLREAAVPGLQAIVDKVYALVGANSALLGQQAGLRAQAAALVEFTKVSADDENKLQNLRRQNEAVLQGTDALKEKVDLQRAEAEFIERANLAVKAGGAGAADAITAAAKRLITTKTENELLEDRTDIISKQEAFEKTRAGQKTETSNLQAQVEAARQGDKFLEKRVAHQNAIRAAQEAANQLSELDVEGRKRAYDVTFKDAMLQENLKIQLKDINEQRRAGEADAAKAQREREAALEREAKLKQQLEEKTKRFFEGPVTSIRLDKESAQEQLRQAEIVDDKERRIAKDKFDDLQKLQAFKLAAAKADQNLSAEYIAGIQAEIEATSRLNRELEERLEKNKQLQAIRDEADPNKALREERANIQDALGRGVFNPAETVEAKERLEELTFAMSDLKRAADELASAGNPFASLVEAAAGLERVTSVTFANLIPAKQIETGGEAALQVLTAVSDATRLLGVENFELQKGIAIATATINAALAITKVLAQGGAFAVPLAVAIGALAGAQIAIIASQQPPERALGGPVGAGSMYRVGERGPELYRSLSGKNYMIPGEGGNVTPANQNAGGVVINNLGPPVSATASVDSSGTMVVTIDAAVKASEKKFEDQLAKGYGGFSRGIRRNTNAGRRIA